MSSTPEIEDGKAIVVDLETSVKNKGDNACGVAHWACPDNKIVLGCCVNLDMSTGEVIKGESVVVDGRLFATSIATHYPRLLIGHNIKFDLLYLLRFDERLRSIFGKVRIWDTAHVAYLLSGQRHTFPSLDDLCDKYKLPKKDDRIKTMWDSGMDTEDIPRDMLKEYCKQDAENTAEIFKMQLNEVADKGMWALVESQMDFLQALVEMEYNGMQVDKDKLEELINVLKIDYAATELDLLYKMKAHGIRDPNPASNVHLNLLLFGGEQEYTDSEVMVDESGNPVLYKSGPKKGKPRWKTVTKKVTIPCDKHTPPIPATTKKNKQGLYSVDEDALKAIASPTSVAILHYRGLAKELNTYADGYKKYLWPETGRIHPNFNTTITPTGRISSSRPNMQNIKREDE
jgi:DNA polymerase-1